MQLDFAGTLAIADGRYLAVHGLGGPDGSQSVLVIETLGTPPLPPRRRRRPQTSDPEAIPGPLPLSRVTVVRAFEPFESEREALSWLDGALQSVGTADALVDEAMALLNRALHAHGAASGNPYAQELSPERSVGARVGFGDGDEVSGGRFAAAREVDVQATPGSRRRRRAADLRPQERLAAVLGGREKIDACETLIPRARADLEAHRNREAALQLRVGLDALLAELGGGVADPDHERDIESLEARRAEIGVVASRALERELDAAAVKTVGEVLGICERVLRRRRVLRG